MKANSTLRHLMPLLAILFLGILHISYAQQSSSIAFPTDTYVGSAPSIGIGGASVDIPLGAIGGQSMSVPVSLTYNNTGIRVNEVAGPAGLGWQIAGAGVITRVVRGMPDDQKWQESNWPYYQIGNGVGGYAGRNTYNYTGRGSDLKRIIDPSMPANNSEYTTNSKRFRTGEWDSEPDLYVFSFMGYSGRFVLDENLNAVLLPRQDLQIHMVVEGRGYNNFSSSIWVITTSNGTQYIFGGVSMDPDSGPYTETTTFRTQTPEIVGYLPASDQSLTTPTSWYLSKIVSAAGDEEFIFEYQRGEEISYLDTENIRYRMIYNNLNTNPFDGPEKGFKDEVITSDYLIQKTTSVEAPLYLSRIYSPLSQQQIHFLYDGERNDLSKGRRLARVKLQTSPQEVYKEWVLSHSYFGSLSNNTLRLRLDQVWEKLNTPYIFSYNPLSLPARNSRSVDFWGYYNGASNSIAVPAQVYSRTGESYPFSTIGSSRSYALTGGDRSPNPIYMQACVLQKVTYPTGGTIEYTYGCNQYWNNVQQKNENWGGLRVEKIIVKENAATTSPLETTYLYTKENQGAQSSGTVDPAYLNANGQLAMERYVRTFSLLGPPRGGCAQCPPSGAYYLVQSSDITYSPQEVAYSCVSSSQPGKGKIVRLLTGFDNPSSQDVAPLVYKTFEKQVIPSNWVQYPYLIEHFPRITRPWRRGLPTDTKVYDQSGKLRSWAHTDYTFVPAEKSLAGVPFYVRDGTGISYFAIYQEAAEWVQVSKVTNRLYDQQDASKALITTTDYTYNPHNLQVSAVATTHPNGEKFIQRFKYPIDYPVRNSYRTNTGGTVPERDDRTVVVNEMLTRYMTAMPIEIQTWQQNSGEPEKLLSAKVYEYIYWPKSPLLIKNRYFLQSVLFRNSYGHGGYWEIPTPKQMILLKRVWSLPLTTPEEIPSPTHYQVAEVNNNAEFIYTRACTEEVLVDAYDKRGNILQAHSRNDIASSVLYTYNDNLRIASVSNAAHLTLAYTSFENYEDKTYWQYTVAPQPIEGKTGQAYFTSGTVTSRSVPAGKYKLSFWYRGGTDLTINGIGGLANQSNWTLYERIMDNPGQVIIVCGNSSIDELRLHPEEAHMTTYTYDLANGLTHKTDANQTTVSYQYDTEKRLKLIKDQQGSIVREYEYWMANQDAARWILTGNKRCVITSTGPTGDQEAEERNENTYSPTYAQTRWVASGRNTTQCKPCTGVTYRWVNGYCESTYTSKMVACRPHPTRPYWSIHTYAYGPFSDGSYNYEEVEDDTTCSDTPFGNE